MSDEFMKMARAAAEHLKDAPSMLATRRADLLPVFAMPKKGWTEGEEVPLNVRCAKGNTRQRRSRRWRRERRAWLRMKVSCIVWSSKALEEA